jgi:hypothetical protein
MSKREPNANIKLRKTTYSNNKAALETKINAQNIRIKQK